MTAETAEHAVEHAAEHALTPSSYIGHHLTFLHKPVGEGGFWTLHLDSLITAGILGVAVTITVGWLLLRLLVRRRAHPPAEPARSMERV